MIYLIKYKRTINGVVYDKTATFITKEKHERKIYLKWIKQHSMNFIKAICLVSIRVKYPENGRG